MPSPEGAPSPAAWSHSANTDLAQLVAAAADLCRRPLRHGVVVPPEVDPAEASLDCCLRLEARDPQGRRLPEEDLDLELYRSGEELNLTLAWTRLEERPLLWHGSHAVWMEGASGLRCQRPPEGLPLEALARRLRALLAQG